MRSRLVRRCAGGPGEACDELVRGTYCRRHATRREHDRHNAQYDDPEYRRAARRAVAEHRRQHGDWCPGYGVPAHRTSDLTAGHPIALARGGPLVQRFWIGCRACNARMGTKTPATVPA